MKLLRLFFLPIAIVSASLLMIFFYTPNKVEAFTPNNVCGCTPPGPSQNVSQNECIVESGFAPFCDDNSPKYCSCQVPFPIKISADSNIVPYGGSTNLNWRSRYPRQDKYTCRAASPDWSGSKSLNGSENTGLLFSNKSYRIGCSAPVSTFEDYSTTNVTVLTPTPSPTGSPPVTPTPTLSPTPTPTLGRDASCVSISAPTSVVTGAPVLGSVTMRNNGGIAWTSPNYKLADGSAENPPFLSVWNLPRVALPSTPINPNQSTTFNFIATAPNTPGSYLFSWKMLEEGVAWFGQSCTKPITVTNPTLGVTLTANPNKGVNQLNTTLQATVSGTASGTINYSFWWNCNTSTTSVNIANSQCGALNTPPVGSCQETPNIGYKCDGVITNPQAINHLYTTIKTHYPKVIVERGSANPAEKRTPVTVSASRPPSVSNIRIDPIDYCVAIDPSFTISWDYTDPDDIPKGADPQTSSQVQVSKNSNFSSPVYSQIAQSSATYRTIPNLQWNTGYYTRVRVWDSYAKPSSFASPPSLPFNTPIHPYPRVDFTTEPTRIPLNQEASFKDQTTFFGSSGQSWDWTWAVCAEGPLTVCAKARSNEQNPKNTFTKEKTYTATLKATDTDNYSCVKSKTLEVGERSIPIWREVAP